jgi:hypothetical protein
MTTLLTLPNELLLEIASFLPHGSVFTLLLTNRRLQQLLEGELYTNPTPRHIISTIWKNRRYPHNISTLQRFLDNGLDIRTDLRHGFEPPKEFPILLLDLAVFCGSLEITRLLLETGEVDIEEYEVWKENVLEPGDRGYAMLVLLEAFGVPMVENVSGKLPKKPGSRGVPMYGGKLRYMPKNSIASVGAS